MLNSRSSYQVINKGVRSFASATHIPVPSRPRDASVSVCPGEGAGPQLIDAVLEIFDYMKVPLNTEMIDYSSLKRGQENESLKKNN